MKKDIKSILLDSLAAMDLPSSSKIAIPIDLTLDVRDDSGDSDYTNFDDSIPSMDGIPTYDFCWHGDTSLNVRSPCLHGGPLFFDRRSCCILVVHVCATTHLTKWVFGIFKVVQLSELGLGGKHYVFWLRGQESSGRSLRLTEDGWDPGRKWWFSFLGSPARRYISRS